MSKFKELFQEAIPEFDEEDQAVALAVGQLIDTWNQDIAEMQELFPDLPAESVTRPVEEAQEVLVQVSTREFVARARGAHNAAVFFSFVAEALRSGLGKAAPE